MHIPVVIIRCLINDTKELILGQFFFDLPIPTLFRSSSTSYNHIDFVFLMCSFCILLPILTVHMLLRPLLLPTHVPAILFSVFYFSSQCPLLPIPVLLYHSTKKEHHGRATPKINLRRQLNYLFFQMNLLKNNTYIKLFKKLPKKL